ncbi:MAG: phenylalanine--tRNA ligase subunit beta [Hyphomicrobiales bacterium]
MKFTLSWLRDYLDFDDTLDAVLEQLTLIGLEVEGVEDPAQKLEAFKIAEVISAEQHPDADRLRVLSVNNGGAEPIQVVCGAPNARAGMKGVLGLPGDYVPGLDITLSVGKIRGVESCGMMCSGSELETSEDHDGILDLPDDAPVGTPYAVYAGMDDPVIEIGVTPNRPDVLGVYGIARDLAATGLGKLKNKTTAPVRGNGPCPVSVDIQIPEFCPAFGLRLVRGVKNGPSPEWMQKRLNAIGLRPINALVDITNYMTFDRGRPLHVFDAAKVSGNLVIRRAKAGEEIAALNDKTYKLDETMGVIADDAGVESLAGIIGATRSGSEAETVDVLIESALWHPLQVAQAGRKLGLSTDARYRFERGVDPNFMVSGLEEATQFVLDICGGEASDIHIAGAIPDVDKIIDFPTTEVKRLGGIDPEPREIKAILELLGFWVTGHAPNFKVAVPSYRPDIFGKADLVEEVVRIFGINDVPSTPLPPMPDLGAGKLTLSQMRNRRSKRLLASRGMMEAVTWSFVSKTEAEAFGGGQEELKLANPISSDLSDMRPSLLPGLLLASQRNADRGTGDVALFEVGQVFHGDQPDDQNDCASGIRRGLASTRANGRHWSGTAQTVSVFDAKEDALSLLSGLGTNVDNLQIVAGGPDHFHPGRSGTIQQGPKNIIGHFGEFHPRVLDKLDVEGTLVGFEIDLKALPAPRVKPTKTKGAMRASDLQPLHRDFAFVVSKDVSADKLLRAAKGADKKLITKVTLFDVFEGDALGADKKSLAIDVTLQPDVKTMTDEEIEAVASKIVLSVEKATGGALRG